MRGQAQRFTCQFHPRKPLARPPTHHRTPPIPFPTIGEQEVLLPLAVKDAFNSVVRTCAVSREGLGSLEEAILQVRDARGGRALRMEVVCLGQALPLQHGWPLPARGPCYKLSAPSLHMCAPALPS